MSSQLPANLKWKIARADTYRITLAVAHATTGVLVDHGVWDKSSGGDKSSSSTTWRPGGMSPPIAVAGPATTSNIVLSRAYRLERDHEALQGLLDGVGCAAAVIKQQVLDANGNAYGKALITHGLLTRVSPPDTDSNDSTGGAAIIELEFIVDGYPTVG